MDKKYLLQLEFDKVLDIIAKCAKTYDGKNQVRKIVPLDDKSEILSAINLTTNAKTILDNEGQNAFPLQYAENPENILTSARLSEENIISLYKTLISSRLVKNFLLKNKGIIYDTYFEALLSDKSLEDKITSVFDENYKIRDDASSELKRLKTSLNANNEHLQNSINNLLKDNVFLNCLQDTICTQRMGRSVFQVRASEKSKVKGIVHDVSSSNKTFFIEPEILVGINNKIRQLECAVETEIQRILCELAQEFHKIKPQLIASYKALIELDVIFAKGEYSILTNAMAPVISDEKVIKLFNAAHPLLINSKNLVKNDFELGEVYKSVLITGSNTGGKTVMMKTVGLGILMAKSGMHVLADYSKIYPFRNVFCDIEEKQDITQSLSTFSAHMKNISSIIEIANSDDLILFDELGAGTDPIEGAALAKAILEYLSKKDIITICTTHLGELKILQYENEYFKNASVEFDTNSLKPLYKLIIGLAGNSYALDIAKNYGLKNEIITAAYENLNKNNNPQNGIFNKIQQTHQTLMEHTKKIEETKNSCIQKQKELDEDLKEIKQKKKKTLDEFKKKHQTNFENARTEIKTILDELYRQKSEKIARRSYSRVAEIEQAVRKDFISDENELLNKYPSIDWNEIKIGQTVLVKNINQPAILKSYPNNKDMVEIQMGLIKSKIHKSKLAKTNAKVNKKLKKSNVSFDDFHQQTGFVLRLDLRGMRAQEALDALEHHIDLAIRRNIYQFTVIHGVGSGALKKAVKEYLSGCPFVSKFRSGDENEGGDGVCIIDVK